MSVTRPDPSPEVKAILRAWCEQQRVKYGPDWKEKLAAEMAPPAAKLYKALSDVHDQYATSGKRSQAK
jgi:hypothetical protein